MKLLNFFKLLWRFILFCFLIYFFNADSRMIFRFNWNLFSIWLIVSLLCQPFLLNMKGLFSDVSLKKPVLKDGTHHPSVLRASYDSATQDDTIEFAGSLVLSILIVLFGPIILIIRTIIMHFKN